jgi:hypothetical protein
MTSPRTAKLADRRAELQTRLALQSRAAPRPRVQRFAALGKPSGRRNRQQGVWLLLLGARLLLWER